MRFELEKFIIDVDDIFFVIRYKLNAQIELEDAIEISDLVYKYFPDKNSKLAMINDIRESRTISKQARDFFASRGENRPNSFNALIINKHVQGMMIKMYYVFSKPAMVTKVFFNEQDAIEWLKYKLNLT